MYFFDFFVSKLAAGQQEDPCVNCVGFEGCAEFLNSLKLKK